MSRTVFRRTGGFTDYDFHLTDNNAQPQTAPPIEITLTFPERHENEWPEELAQILSDAITRTQETITLTHSRQVQGWAKPPSRFLSEMGVI
jgi:hypothetical protein